MKRPVPETDSQKIRLIPEMMASLAELYRIIVTGDLASGEPGLLEDIRNIKKGIDDISEKQVSIVELERRVNDIEERHKREDADKERRGKRFDAFTLAAFSIALSNVVMIILWLLGFGR